jgi:hypothetical protein
MKKISLKILAIAIASLILLCGFNSMFGLIDSAKAENLNTKVNAIPDYSYMGNSVYAKFALGNQKCACPIEGDKGGLLARDGDGNQFVFIDSNGNWQYDTSEQVIYDDPDCDKKTANPTNGDKGGLYTIEHSEEQIHQNNPPYYNPYVFIDSNDNWLYDNEETIIDFDPDKDGNNAQGWNIYDGDKGGLLALDKDNNPYTFKDVEKDWTFQGESIKFEINCLLEGYEKPSFILFWWECAEQEHSDTWDEAYYKPDTDSLHYYYHVYDKPSSFKVRIQISDSHTGSNRQSEDIDVNTAVSSDLDVTATEENDIEIGEKVKYTIQSTSGLQKWKWIFDDEDPEDSSTDWTSDKDASCAYITTGRHTGRIIFKKIGDNVEYVSLLPEVSVKTDLKNEIDDDIEDTINDVEHDIQTGNNYLFDGSSLINLFNNGKNIFFLHSQNNIFKYFYETGTNDIVGKISTLLSPTATKQQKGNALVNIINTIKTQKEYEKDEILFDKFNGILTILFEKKIKSIDDISFGIDVPIPDWVYEADPKDIPWINPNNPPAPAEIFKQGVQYLINKFDEIGNLLGININNFLNSLTSKINDVVYEYIDEAALLIVLAIFILLTVYTINNFNLLHIFVGRVVTGLVTIGIVTLLGELGFIKLLNDTIANIPRETIPLPDWDYYGGIAVFIGIIIETVLFAIYKHVPGVSQMVAGGLSIAFLVFIFVMVTQLKKTPAVEDVYDNIKRDSVNNYLNVLANDGLPGKIPRKNLTLHDVTNAWHGEVSVYNETCVRYNATVDKEYKQDKFKYFIKDDKGNTYDAFVTINLKGGNTPKPIPIIKLPILRVLFRLFLFYRFDFLLRLKNFLNPE